MRAFYQFRLTGSTTEPLFWLRRASRKMKYLLLEFLIGSDQSNSYQIGGDQLHRFLERVFLTTRCLTFDEQHRLLVAYTLLTSEPTGSAAFFRNLDEIEQVMREIA
jgi:hypothetical protein